MLLALGLLTYTAVVAAAITEEEMLAVLSEYDTAAKALCNENVMASWNVATDSNNDDYKTVQVRESFQVQRSFCARDFKLGDQIASCRGQVNNVWPPKL